jgi:hypothetical protein
MLEAILIYTSIYSFIASQKLRPPFQNIKQAMYTSATALIAAIAMLVIRDTKTHEFVAALGVIPFLWASLAFFKPVWPFKRRSHALISAILFACIFSVASREMEENYMAQMQKENPAAYEKELSDRKAREEKKLLEKAQALQEEWKEKKCGDKSSAELMMEHFIEERLKAPKTADFSDFDAQEIKCGVWEGVVTVDAQNSFGALIRSRFYIKIQQTFIDNWRIIELKNLN